jgi:ornithine carbamoyltransferase
MHHLLSLAGMSAADITELCAEAQLLKQRRANGTLTAVPLAGRTIALLFEKPSLRTRVSFEVAARELGAQSLYLSPQEVGLNRREAAGDVARVLSSYVHAIVVRTFDHAVVETMAQHAAVPVINGLTDAHHPCQGLTDVCTILEACDKRHPVVAYVGDGNNCAHSLLQACATLGMHVRVATSAPYAPDPVIVAQAGWMAQQAGGSLTLMHDPVAAVHDADVIYTDVWTSMGQEAEAAHRRATFAPYQVNRALLAHALPSAIVLHPLPAHRGEEITDEVLDGSQSWVFVQAENRLHMQKAILRHLLRVSHPALLSA